MSTSKQARSLRSKSMEEQNDYEKFDFDTPEYDIDSMKRLIVDSKTIPLSHRNTHSKYKKRIPQKVVNYQVDKETKIRESIDNMTLTVRNNSIFKVDDSSFKDPLFDSIYTPYHKKMLKQEKRMLEQDQAQSDDQADKLSLIYDKLNMNNWQTTLQRITKIIDPSDNNELINKKELTIKAIESMLNKYNIMKQRSVTLQRCSKPIKPIKKFFSTNRTDIYHHIERRFLQDYASSSESDDTERLPIDKLRIARLNKREEYCGGSIILGCGKTLSRSRYVIIGEPLRDPYVILTTHDERKQWKNIAPEHKRLKNVQRTTYRVAKPIRRLIIPVTLTSMKLEGHNMDDNVHPKDLENIPNLVSKSVDESANGNSAHSQELQIFTSQPSMQTDGFVAHSKTPGVKSFIQNNQSTLTVNIPINEQVSQGASSHQSSTLHDNTNIKETKKPQLSIDR